MNVFKLYLARVLGSNDSNTEEAGPLQLYNPVVSTVSHTLKNAVHNYLFFTHQPRSQIGEVLAARRDLGSPAPYIPSFYQDCRPIIPGVNSEVRTATGTSFPSLTAYSLSPQNQLMQQPLSHLYFLTVLEHLLVKEHSLAQFVRCATNIQKVSTDTWIANLSEVVYLVF